MSQDKILAALDGLHQTASRMKRVTESMRRAQNTLNDIVSECDSIWEGQARDHYDDESRRLIVKMKEFEQLMEERTQQLTESVRVYERVESQNVTSTENLSATDIF